VAAITPYQGVGPSTVTVQTTGNLGSATYAFYGGSDVYARLEVKVEGLTKEEALEILEAEHELLMSMANDIQRQLDSAMTVLRAIVTTG